MDIEKWEWNLDCGGMEVNSNGDYVRLYDFEAVCEDFSTAEKTIKYLAKQNAVLAAENERLEAGIAAITKISPPVNSGCSPIEHLAMSPTQLINHCKGMLSASYAARVLPESVKNDLPEHVLHQRLIAVADWLVVLAPDCYVDARSVVLKAAAVIKAAQEQEPIAYRVTDGEGGWDWADDIRDLDPVWQMKVGRKIEPLYDGPVPIQSPAVVEGEYFTAPEGARSVFVEGLGSVPVVRPIEKRPIWNVGDKVRVHGYPGTVVEADSLSELKDVVWVDVPEYNSICAYPLDSVWLDYDRLDALKAHGLCEQGNGWLEEEVNKCAEKCKNWPDWRRGK